MMTTKKICAILLVLLLLIATVPTGFAATKNAATTDEAVIKNNTQTANTNKELAETGTDVKIAQTGSYFKTISIPILRAENDKFKIAIEVASFTFQSPFSVWRTTTASSCILPALAISIPVLRVENDLSMFGKFYEQQISIPVLRVEND